MANSINWGKIYESTWWGNDRYYKLKTKQKMFRLRRSKPKMKQLKVQMNKQLEQAIILCKLKARLKRYKK